MTKGNYWYKRLEQGDNEMTNLRQAAEMALEALTTFERICSPEHLHIYETITIPEAVKAIRQALAEPDTGIDRGAWDDVPDATKWLDELRGGEEISCGIDNLEFAPQGKLVAVYSPIGEIQTEQMERPFNANKIIVHFYNDPPPVGTKLYAEPPKREWVGLTDEEIADAVGSPIDDVYLADFRKIEAKLREKNT